MKSFVMGCAAALALALPFTAGAESAADFPSKPIHIIVPYSAGGIVDTLSRIIGERLSKKYGQPVIVETKPGAGGAIGNDYVAKAAPDGYTLLCVSPGLAVLPSLQKSVTWTTASFQAIEGLGVISNVWVVPSSSPVKTMPELIALAKKKAAAGAPLTYATAGIGTSNHLSGELLSQMAGIKLTQVPYKGQPNALTDLLAGRVDSMPLTAALAQAHVKSGQLRPLAVTTKQRSSAFPDVPTVAEATGLHDYAVGTWFGFVAPAKTPDAIVEKLSHDIAEIIAEPGPKKQLVDLGMEVVPQNAKQFNAYLASESARWTKVIKQAGIEPQ